MHELRATQDRIIEEAIQESRLLTFFLKSGVSIKGTVVAHDSYTVFLLNGKDQTLIYKHFVTSVFPARFLRGDSESDSHRFSETHRNPRSSEAPSIAVDRNPAEASEESGS